MTWPDAPILDGRDLDAIVSDLMARLPGYVPGWKPPERGPGWALLQIFARDLRALLERLNQAPDKNRLAFLDLMGISLLPAQAARAPVVFAPRPRMGDGRLPAGTRVGATSPRQSDPVVFETERDVALAAGQLAEVVSLWPGQDAYADHSTAAVAGTNFTMFQQMTPVPHELYVAHGVHLALAGMVTVNLQFELSGPANQSLSIAWEYWDGKVWRGFKTFMIDDKPGESFDGTRGLTRSGVVRLAADCAESAKTTVNGYESYWVRGRVTAPMPPVAGFEVPVVDRIKISTTISADGIQPDAAFADGTKLDLTKAFLPLGHRPQPGSAFYFCSQDVFSKPRAAARAQIDSVDLPQNPHPDLTLGFTALTPTLVWEYWLDGRWNQMVTSLPGSDPKVGTLLADGEIDFEIPEILDATKVNDVESLWMRVRLTNGGYGATASLKLTSTGPTIQLVEVVPPALGSITLGYDYESSQDPPEVCLTYSDFRWEDHTEDAAWRGSSFEAFTTVADRTPALYLGFDHPLPADLIGLYFDLVETTGGANPPPLRWEYWDGSMWAEVAVQDETADLSLPGMVDVTWPGVPVPPQLSIISGAAQTIKVSEPRWLVSFVPDDVVLVTKGNNSELGRVASVRGDTMILKTPLSTDYSQGTVARAGLPRFGLPRTWIRARMQFDGQPRETHFNGIYVNAAWASQMDTYDNELLGSSTGQPDQVFFFRHAPVLAGQVVEVRELDGLRAAVELPLLLEDLSRAGMSAADTRQVLDPRTGAVTEVWVSWHERPNLFLSGPGHRHYVVERSRGRLMFGDDVHGRVPLVGRDNIRARTYRSGGGEVGNVPAGAINQLLSGVLAQSVTNARAAEGGAHEEPPDEISVGGPRTIRDRRQAVTLGDYEALGREASPAVAVARALPTTEAPGRQTPGWVKLVIVPNSEDAQPQPSFELRHQVQAFLAARMPAAASGHVAVTGPDYLPIGVRAVVAPVDPSAGGPVRDAVIAALEVFLHPLIGGPDGAGWPFGRDVYLSDVAVLLEGVAGVDHVETLDLLLDGTPRGEVVAVPPDRIVVAGTLRISLTGTEG